MSTAHDMPVTLLPSPEHAPLLRLVPESSEPLDFDNAVRRLRPRLHRYAERRLGDSHEAEELVREALLRAYSHRPQLLTEDDLAAWTTVVTGRLVIDRLRVRGRSTSVAEVPEGNRTVRDTADVVVARDEACTALDALDAMPSRQAAEEAAAPGDMLRTPTPYPPTNSEATWHTAPATSTTQAATTR